MPFKLVLNGKTAQEQLGDRRRAENEGCEVTKVHRYTDDEDISILKEVVVEKAFGKCPRKWQSIHNRLGIKVKDYRCIQRRYELLLEKFKQKSTQSKLASGVDEEYTEKDNLLQEIVDLLSIPENSQTEDSDKKDKRKSEEDFRQAQIIRDAALETMTAQEGNASDEPSPRPKRRKETDFMNYLRDTDKREHDTKILSLDLEKRRIELLERELKLKEENEAHRRDMERRRMDFEEKRLEMEDSKTQKDMQEKSLLYQMLERQMSCFK